MSFLEFAIAADLEANGRCSFGLAGDGFFNAHIAWIFQKHSPITKIINNRYSQPLPGELWQITSAEAMRFPCFL